MNRLHPNFRTRSVRCGCLLAAALVVLGPTALAQQGSLYVVDGKVGVGTDAPQVSLEVQGNSGTTALLVDENSGTTQLRSLITLENQGPPRMLFRDASNSKSWRVGAYFGNTFRLDTPSGTGVEAELDANGNLSLSGTLSQGSSRTLKENFTSLDPEAVLAKVAELPVTRWNYRFDPDRRAHIGPTAEDFRAAFGLGDSDRRLAPSDAAGVALVAIQGLNEVVRTERAELEGLRAENARLEAAIEAMGLAQEQLLRRLEALETRNAASD